MGKRLKRPRYDGSDDKAFLLGFVLPVIALVVILFLMAFPVNAGTYSNYLKFSTDNWGEYFDSIIVKTYCGMDTTMRDSLYLDSAWLNTDIDTFVSFNDDSTYAVRVWYSYSGNDGFSTPSTAIIPMRSAGAATVSAVDKAEIASLVDDTLSTVHGSGSWSPSAGGGANSVRIYAIDTSGTDDSIYQTTITVKTMAGALEGSITTNTNGYSDFTLGSDSFLVLGNKHGYTWLMDTVVVGANDTIDLSGYDWDIPSAPSGTTLCAVYGYEYDQQGTAAKYVILTFTLNEDVYNSCDSTGVVRKTVSVVTDGNGRWDANLLRSYPCLDSIYYNVTVDAAGVANREHQLFVPNDSLYRVEW